MSVMLLRGSSVPASWFESMALRIVNGKIDLEVRAVSIY